MGTIRICDWLKITIARDTPVHILKIGNKEFEVCTAAVNELLHRLEGSTVTPVASAPLAPPKTALSGPQLKPADPGLIDEEAVDDAFGGPIISELDAVSPHLNRMPVAPIPVPASTKERLATPSAEQIDAVIEESRRFEEGKLHTLSPGKQRQLAMKKLADIEQQREANEKKRKDVFDRETR
jgi:hypothetical protein